MKLFISTPSARPSETMRQTPLYHDIGNIRWFRGIDRRLSRERDMRGTLIAIQHARGANANLSVYFLGHGHGNLGI